MKHIIILKEKIIIAIRMIVQNTTIQVLLVLYEVFNFLGEMFLNIMYYKYVHTQTYLHKIKKFLSDFLINFDSFYSEFIFIEINLYNLNITYKNRNDNHKNGTSTVYTFFKFVCLNSFRVLFFDCITRLKVL